MADIKSNLTASTAPQAANDTSQGYAKGSRWYNGATGVWWTCDNAAAGAAEWFPNQRDVAAVPSNYLVGPSYIMGYQDSSGIVGGKLISLPFYLNEKMRVSGIGVVLASGSAGSAGAAVRLGIRRVDPSARTPAALKVDAGAIALDSSVGAGNRVIAIDQFLVPGHFRLEGILNPVTTMPVLRRINSAIPGYVPVPDLTDPTQAYRYYEADVAYGALPSVEPTLAPSAGSNGFGIFLRRA